MGLLNKPKTRESDDLRAERATVKATLDANIAKLASATTDEATARANNDPVAMVAATALAKAYNALVADGREQLKIIDDRIAAAVEAEDNTDFLAQCENLAKQEKRRAQTYGPDYAKAAASVAAFLADDAAKVQPVLEANKRLRAMGRQPILTAEERARTTPGRTEPAVFEDRVVWRKFAGGPEVVVFGKNAAGEMVPMEVGAVRSVERRCVRPERVIHAVHPKPLAEAVVLPGFMGGEAPLWPKGGA